MQRNLTAGTLAAGLFLFAAGSVQASPLPEETITLPEDRLAVTVASASAAQKDPLESDLTIWVGEIELEGRNAVWVELIDSYGEVIYDSELHTNETHLLPDGRAVVVRAMDAGTVVADKDQSRIGSDGTQIVTRRVVNEGQQATTVEFIETGQPVERDTMLEVAGFGDLVWQKIVAFFEAAQSQIKVAWTWLVGTLQA